RIDFLFMHIIRAHSCDESTVPDIFFAHEKFIRSRAGDTKIALLNCACQITNRFDAELKVGRNFVSEINRCTFVYIERVDFGERQNPMKGSKMCPTLLSAAANRSDG